jgi:DNA (cytosine-5)-methyltransferase 1
LSLFSGIEAASVAWERLGWECAAVAEIEPFPCKVLAHRYPDVPNLGDITQITQERIEALGHIDLVVFGAPCQDLSVAGKRKGMLNEDGSPTRSGLFYAAERIATWSGARWAIYENVPGMFSSNAGADFASVVGEMAGADFDVPKNKWRNAGVAVGPRGLVEWVTLDAQYVRTPEFARAVPQRRRRVFIVRDSGDWASRPPLFLEPESLCGNPPPSRKTGQTVAHDVAGSLVSSGQKINRTGDTRGQDPVIAVGGEVSHTLRGEGFDASEDGTGRGTPIIRHMACVAPTLNAHFGEKQGLENQRIDSGAGLFIAIQGSVIGSTDHAGPAGSGVDETGACFTLLKTDVHAVPTFGIRTANTSSNGCGVSEELSYTLDRAQGRAVAYRTNAAGQVAPQDGTAAALNTFTDPTAQFMMTPARQVRRLTPLECERLQGFPEVRKNVTIRVVNSGGNECSDRQKTCANVVAQSPKLQNAAGNAERSESQKSASYAAPNLSASNPKNSPHAVAHVHLNLEAKTLEIRRARRSLLDANRVGKTNSYPLPIEIENTARLLVQQLSELGIRAEDGKAGSPQSKAPFLTLGNGRWSVEIFGREIEELVSDAGASTTKHSERMKYTTGAVGSNSLNLERNAQISCCFVASAINSFIPEQMRLGNSYEINLEVSHGWTNIPGASDSARYRALGNSMACNVMHFIGQRINDSH